MAIVGVSDNDEHGLVSSDMDRPTKRAVGIRGNRADSKRASISARRPSKSQKREAEGDIRLSRRDRFSTPVIHQFGGGTKEGLLEPEVFEDLSPPSVKDASHQQKPLLRTKHRPIWTAAGFSPEYQNSVRSSSSTLQRDDAIGTQGSETAQPSHSMSRLGDQPYTEHEKRRSLTSSDAEVRKRYRDLEELCTFREREEKLRVRKGKHKQLQAERLLDDQHRDIRGDGIGLVNPAKSHFAYAPHTKTEVNQVTKPLNSPTAQSSFHGASSEVEKNRRELVAIAAARYINEKRKLQGREAAVYQPSVVEYETRRHRRHESGVETGLGLPRHGEAWVKSRPPPKTYDLPVRSQRHSGLASPTRHDSSIESPLDHHSSERKRNLDIPETSNCSDSVHNSSLESLFVKKIVKGAVEVIQKGTKNNDMSSSRPIKTGVSTCASFETNHVSEFMVDSEEEPIKLPSSGDGEVSKMPSITVTSDLSTTQTKNISAGSVSEEIVKNRNDQGDQVEDENDLNSHSSEEMKQPSRGSEIETKTALKTAMNVVKGLLLRELFEYASSEAKDAIGGSVSSSSISNTESSSYSSVSPKASASQAPQRGKRMRSDDRDPGDGDDGSSDDSDDDERPKKKKEKGPQRAIRRLKCPFYQRQPEKYQKGACKGEGFTDLAKLKDHIKRRHTQPLKCVRCWSIMESAEQMSEHLQKDDICAKKPEPQDDRIRQQLLKQLDFKKAPYSKAKNVEEKWEIMFKELFPGETIPSPYEQQGISLQLERALSEALEEELTRELAPVLAPIMTRIKQLTPAIIERCRTKLMCDSPSSDEGSNRTLLSQTWKPSRKPRNKKQPLHSGNATASRCLAGGVDLMPTAEVLSSKSWGKQPQLNPLPGRSGGTHRLQGVTSMRDNGELIMPWLDSSRTTMNDRNSSVNNFVQIRNDGIESGSDSFLGTDVSSAIKEGSVLTNNTSVVASEPYNFADCWMPQSNMNIPYRQSFSNQELEFGLDGEGVPYGQYPDKQLGSAVTRDQGPSREWDHLTTETFEFPYFYTHRGL
ncbi:hypothetical protein BS50DRAFT_569340 [Corynespora cassiicola Philippines]|uniref:C2H2-type domain-containing protein n=1 Tax=Corynespora cassiicola Philippines TaxID=1448308 RepID=A0A2T2P235_CORCC|nr:hypothetical protein BS50DRAFT_569340 [Corynespora cassiicola Philippines]